MQYPIKLEIRAPEAVELFKEILNAGHGVLPKVLKGKCRLINLLSKNKHFLILFSVVAINSFLAPTLFGTTGGDTSSYIGTINGFIGVAGGHISPRRMLNPLYIILSAPLAFYVSPKMIIVSLNILFYFLLAPFFFKFVLLFYDDKDISLFSTLLFISSFPVLQSGLKAMTDMGAWFFYVLSLFLTIHYFKIDKRDRWIYLNGLISALGVLVKPNGGLGIVFFFLTSLFIEKNFKIILKQTLRFCVIFIMLIGVNQLIIYFKYNYSYWVMYQSFGAGLDNTYWEEIYTFKQFMTGIISNALFGWFFIFYGLIIGIKEWSKEQKLILLALIPSSFSFLLWGAGFDIRLVFVIGPLIYLIAGYGLNNIFIQLKRNKPLLVLLITFTIFFNYIILHLAELTKYNIKEVIRLLLWS